MVEFKLETPSPTEWIEQLNITKYAYRQSLSCIFLDKMYSKIINQFPWSKDESVVRLLTYLSKVVHKRQFNDLDIMHESFEEYGRPHFIPETVHDDSTFEYNTSHYFNQLYAFHNLKPFHFDNMSESDIMNIFIIQYVAYLRGADRYSLLRDYPNDFQTQWQNFFYDAVGNASNVFYYLLRNYENADVYMKIAETIKFEDKLIKSIWDFNKDKINI